MEVLTERDIKLLRVFERRILRKETYGQVKEVEEWRRRYNKELYQWYKLSDIITNINIEN